MFAAPKRRPSSAASTPRGGGGGGTAGAKNANVKNGKAGLTAGSTFGEEMAAAGLSGFMVGLALCTI